MTHSPELLAHLLAVATQQETAGQERNWRALSECWARVERDDQERLLGELLRLHVLKNRCMDAASHDLRGDVAAIRGFAELLAEELPAESSGQEYLGIITSLATKLLVAMHDLLDFRLIEQGGFVLHRTEGDLAALVRSRLAAWAPVAVACGLAVHEELAALPPCFFDAERLGQVVDRLLALAARSAPRGSAVRVRLAVIADQAAFVLENEGVAVSEVELAQWFEPGRQENLALVRRVVESHYGTLAVANLLQQGRRFSFTIPVHV